MPTIDINPGKRERTRAAIITAATQLIAEKGLEASSIDDLMAMAGMARGTFYNYFQTREELIQAVLENIQCALKSSVIDHISTELPPDQAVSCMLYGYLEFCRRTPFAGHVLLRTSGFSPWVETDDQSRRRFARVDGALLLLCGDEISFTSARIFLQGMSNNILCHLLSGRLDNETVEEIMALTLRGLGVNEQSIQQALNIARSFVAEYPFAECAPAQYGSIDV